MTNITINNFYATRRPFADGWVPPFRRGDVVRLLGEGYRNLYTVARIIGEGTGRVNLIPLNRNQPDLNYVHYRDIRKV
jgi:hypothetical protein